LEYGIFILMIYHYSALFQHLSTCFMGLILPRRKSLLTRFNPDSCRTAGSRKKRTWRKMGGLEIILVTCWYFGTIHLLSLSQSIFEVSGRAPA